MTSVNGPVGATSGDLGLGHVADSPREKPLAKAEDIINVGESSPVASLAHFRNYRLYQGRAASCVAHALAQGIYVLMRVEGILDPPFASRRYIYFGARAQERRESTELGMTPSPILDQGCRPRLAMRSVERLGFPVEHLFPYSDDPEAISEVPSPKVARAAIDQATLRWSVIESIGSERSRAVAAALSVGKPVIFPTYVDKAFMANRGELIESIDPRDPDGGGHMLLALGVDEDGHVLFDNWWLRFGDSSGMGRMSRDLFGSPIVGRPYVLDRVEDFSEVV